MSVTFSVLHPELDMTVANANAEKFLQLAHKDYDPEYLHGDLTKDEVFRLVYNLQSLIENADRDGYYGTAIFVSYVARWNRIYGAMVYGLVDRCTFSQ